jgi:hypothetical protein
MVAFCMNSVENVCIFRIHTPPRRHFPFLLFFFLSLPHKEHLEVEKEKESKKDWRRLGLYSMLWKKIRELGVGV